MREVGDGGPCLPGLEQRHAAAPPPAPSPPRRPHPCPRLWWQRPRVLSPQHRIILKTASPTFTLRLPPSPSPSSIFPKNTSTVGAFGAFFGKSSFLQNQRCVEPDCTLPPNTSLTGGWTGRQRQ
ncbi:hypothetical protein FOCC_FOCC002434 [Frankliniella occidentalis]|nr:hypothetical protein FOCC_FOCC002434 [Frankliniella occidentalis]